MNKIGINHIKYYVFCAVLCFCFSAHLFSQTFSDRVNSLKISISNAKSDSEKAKGMLTLSDLYLDNHDPVNALQCGSEALKFSESGKWGKGICCSYIIIADFLQKTNNYDSSLLYYRLCDSIAVENDDKENQVIALKKIGMTYQMKAQYVTAADYYRQVLELSPSIDDKMVILGNLGLIYSNVGDYVNSLICYDSSLKILNDFIRSRGSSNHDDSMQMAALIITRGDVYIAAKQYDQALRSYDKVLELSLNLNNKLLQIWALKGTGNTYYHKNDLGNAIENYKKALDVATNNRKYPEQAEIFSLLGNIYFEKGDINLALAFADSSLNIATRNNLIAQLPDTYTILGKIYTAMRKYPEAVTYLKNAIAMCIESGARDGEKNALQVISNTYELMGQPQPALDAYKKYIAIRDSIYNVAKSNEFTRIDLNNKHRTDSLNHATEYNLRIQKQKVFTYSGFTGLVAVLLLAFFIYRSYNHQKNANIAISKANEIVSDEKQRAEALLLNILPEDVAHELKTKGNVTARLYDHVTVMFTDFVNFTEAGERFSPEELVAELHTCFMAFDRIIGKYHIEKIKTIGDAYLAVSGLPHPCHHHASEIVKAALECRDFMLARKKKLGNHTFSMRIGIHTGTVVAGIVGVKKFAFDIWGDTVNTAARMEQYSLPDKINISSTTYELVKNEFNCTDRGDIDAKHKGMMRMYFVEV